jgi:hypothetical protein
VEGEAVKQVEGEASEQRGSRSTADEGPRASGEGPLVGLAPPQAGGDLEVHGRRDRGFGRLKAGWIEQDDLGCVQGGSSRGWPRAGRIDLRIDAGRRQRSSRAGVVGGRAGRSGSSREAFAPVVWTSLGPLPRWVPGPTTRWAPRTTRLALHGT